MNSKICFKCGKEKALKKFYKHPRMADGHLNKCIECTKKDSNKHREDNLEEVKAYDRKRDLLPHRIKARKEYAKTPNGIEANNKAQNKWTKNNPLKKAATCIVNNAIRGGRLKKQPCEKCGSTVRVHGHHDDYYKPLEVRWLCPKCHKAFHKEYNEKEAIT
jgi:ribosomal protein S27AE